MAPERRQRVAQIVVRLGQAGAPPDRRLEMRQRLRRAAARMQRRAEVVASGDVVGIDLDGARILADRLVEAAERGKREPQVVAGFGGVRSDRQRAAQQAFGRLRPAEPQRKRAEFRQALGILGRVLEDIAIGLLGLGQASLAVQRFRHAQNFGWRQAPPSPVVRPRGGFAHGGADAAARVQLKTA